MTKGSDPILPWRRWLDAERNRIPAVLEDQTGRLQRVEGQLTGLAARFAVIGSFDMRSPGSTRGSTSLSSMSRVLRM
ncbi:MAG: hypothetical protein WAS21_12875 [Geminicoccaceae bacterium]